MKKIVFFLIIVLTMTSCFSSKQVATSNQPSNSNSNSVDYGSPNINQELIDDNTFKINKYSTDSTYGYTIENPIMVGNAGGSGPVNERRFINALTGPNGEIIEYYRLGSCCHFKTSNGLFGDSGLLDKYSLTYRGLKKDLVIYINMYDSDTLKVPIGLELKK